ncbi:putative undecaprenyl-phosphate alpha-N-acetylglucosaminyl 1-phosphatetransferase [Luminiphilus syltensis NOR5-1B]|uniref:Putative undecaprenyl-phosphate alpha-N-acetylglucosaminyl 1-phosphatetransferase n=1 Tax=Luminiphilus syltensis NOR5-1B TaxID=565045 RepID=B8KX38_9GAMM|nr:putative undecaprenyl-phosphate alpha-N-acetylglucosaminyl 1-phosphatetransferase [Luminiphilus syltensis]EED36462.1 putative undecaprenyl-phosphate alpha-N-acetylglucosaminyl 1-phosphatetransferase [Luminiphilus syltensis NOR5-1B]
MLLLCGSVFAVTLILLLGYGVVAPRFGLIDSPNARSQHRHPTVVGAGFAVVMGITGGVLALESVGIHPWPQSQLLIVVALLLSTVGLVDDRFHLPVCWRLLVFFAAAVAAVGVQSNPLVMGWMSVFVVVALVWVINLFNFMDGLDGFATLQALNVAIGMGLLAFFGPVAATDLAAASAVLASALAAFLCFNWPPARMFMGDAGSIAIGFLLGVLGLKAFEENLVLGLAWVILMMPFLVDATATLFLRLSQGLMPHIAHADHAYQRLARRTDSPLLVNIGLQLMHLCFQFPCAVVAVIKPEWAPFLVILATVPSLVLLAYTRRST